MAKNPVSSSPRRIRTAAAPAIAEPEAPGTGVETFCGPCEVVEFTRRTRAAASAATEGTEERVVYDIVISSENPYWTFYGEEVLGHAEGEVDLSNARNGVSFLLEHGGPNFPHVDPDMVLGLVTNIRLEGKKLRGAVEFLGTGRAVEIEVQFAQGKRPFISVGWKPSANYTTVVTRRTGKADLLRRSGWRVCEVSLVAVPADFTARKGRSGPGPEEYPVITEGDSPVKEEPKMKRVRHAATGVIETVSEDDPRPAAVEITAAAPEGGNRSETEVRVEGNKRAGQILRMCNRFGLQARAGEFIESGKSVAELLDTILETRSEGGEVETPPAAEHLKPTLKGATHKDARAFRLTRALHCAATGKYDGVEGNFHNALMKRFGVQPRSEHSIFVPMRVAEMTDGEMEQRMELDQRQIRALSSGGAGDSGAVLVTNTQGELIDLLRNAAMFTRLGARTVPGLVGTIQFPKKTVGSSVRRMGESPASGAAESSSKYGWVIGSPKTYIGNTVCPRQLINLTSFDVESDMRQDLIADHGVAFDFDMAYGQGAANEPLGVYPDTATQTQAMGGVPDWQKVIKMVGKVLTKNISSDSISFLTSCLMAAELAVKTRGATTVPPFIWEGDLTDGRIGAYRAASTNQILGTMSGRAKTGASEHGIICGPFRYLMFLLWGVLELQVDTITLADKGQIKVVSFLMGDTVNQRPEAFVVSTGATVTP